MKDHWYKNGIRDTQRSKLKDRIKDVLLIVMSWFIALALVYIIYLKIRLLFHH